MSKQITKIVVDESSDLVAQLDEIAKAEGTSRSALVRRAIRSMFFSVPDFTDFGNLPKKKIESNDND